MSSRSSVVVAGSTMSAALARCGPVLLVDDDGLGLAPGADQAVQVLMMVERVAARPIDQRNVGIAMRAAVIAEACARVQQHVGRRATGMKSRPGSCLAAASRPAGSRAYMHADRVGAAIAQPEAAARQADLAQHGGKRHHRPVMLLAVALPLQRPGGVHIVRPAGHLAREATMVSAGTPVIVSAHSGVCASPSIRQALDRGPDRSPTQCDC